MRKDSRSAAESYPVRGNDPKYNRINPVPSLRPAASTYPRNSGNLAEGIRPTETWLPGNHFPPIAIWLRMLRTSPRLLGQWFWTNRFRRLNVVIGDYFQN